MLNNMKFDKTKTDLHKLLKVILLICAVIIYDSALTYSESTAKAVNNLKPSGIIENWLILGPFPNPKASSDNLEKISRTGFSVDYLKTIGGESSVQISRDTEVAYLDESGNNVKVKSFEEESNRNGKIDFNHIFSENNNNLKIAYAFCWLYSEEDLKIYCYLGSDDSAKIWINGVSVYDKWLPEGRSLIREQDNFTAKLKKGLNPVLIKVENLTGEWGFLLEIYKETDHPLREDGAIKPDNFTLFKFKDYEKASILLNNYLWRFFSKRAINPNALFEQEYLTLSDMWLSDAYDPHTSKKIQHVHRDHLLTVKMDEEGYVHTHQHFSHCHNHGWPFPIWAQIYGGYEGYTYGWHFQDQGPGWVWQFKMVEKGSPNAGQSAADSWELVNVESLGIINSVWQLSSKGVSPTIISPKGVELDSFNSPYIQIRWKRTGKSNTLPYLEWKRDEDNDFNPKRRFYFEPKDEDFSSITGLYHTMIPVYKHPLWSGKIKRLKFVLAPGEKDVEFSIDSIFTNYDTRHTINNPFLILASWEYFRWTGDIDFLKKNMNRLRKALKYQQTVMGGLEYNHIRNQWIGHDGLPGWTHDKDGKLIIHPGHGIGNNYWDLMPFGWDDLYATSQYYKATLVLAELEELVQQNPGWGVPMGSEVMNPEILRKHASKIKRTANKKFWNQNTDRFYAAIDKNGNTHDYGYTFLNLEAIWYGLASGSHGEKIMEWISGKRLIPGDTSTGKDIYQWRFGPRTTTKRNIDWYGQAWTGPETIPWGGQVQDGGAVLGFTFFDLWSRLEILGPDDAWKRLMEILDWEEEVQKSGGYRNYYAAGKQGTTLQGGGTAGGIGIDHEFIESSLMPAIIPYGFMGLKPDGTQLIIDPKLPKACPEMKIENLQFQNYRLDITISKKVILIDLYDQPIDSINLNLIGNWNMTDTSKTGSKFEITDIGNYRFYKE